MKNREFIGVKCKTEMDIFRERQGDAILGNQVKIIKQRMCRQRFDTRTDN